MSGRLQHVGAVPVLREMTRIHRAVREVTIVRRAVLLVQPVGDLLADGGENRRLSRDITVPVEPIDLGSMRLVGMKVCQGSNGEPVTRAEGPNDWERQVGPATHEWKAAEKPVLTGLGTEGHGEPLVS